MNCACGCGQPIPNTREAKYASNRCRAEASRKRRAPIPATVRSVRVLKSGKRQWILHTDPIWGGCAARGDEIGLGVAQPCS